MSCQLEKAMRQLFLTLPFEATVASDLLKNSRKNADILAQPLVEDILQKWVNWLKALNFLPVLEDVCRK